MSTMKNNPSPEYMRRVILYALARLPSGFVTAEASITLVEFSRKIRRGEVPWVVANSGARYVTMPHAALPYLKEFAQQGLLTKQVVDRVDREPLDETTRTRGSYTYMWHWVDE